MQFRTLACLTALLGVTAFAHAGPNDRYGAPGSDPRDGSRWDQRHGSRSEPHDGSRSEPHDDSRWQPRHDPRWGPGHDSRWDPGYDSRWDRRHDAGARIYARQERQHARIRHGLASGALTRHEARELMHEQHDIREAEARARADGRLSPHELSYIERLQDRAGRHIAYEMNDGETRYWRY